MQVNLPKEFSERILQQFGSEGTKLLASLTSIAPTSIRFNPFKSSAELRNKYTQLRPVKWCSDGYYLPSRPIFTADPLFHAGCYYVQEASSMFLSHILQNILDSNKSYKALDLCAAPGGKSTLIASLLPQGSVLIANEVIKSRASILEENLTKWGTTNFVVTNSDPVAFAKIKDFFDLIVIDAPCSGEGMFRKDPPACDEWSVHNVTMCASRQQRIVSDVISSLNPGGYLIYSTCTFSEEENDTMHDWMIEEFDMEVVDIPVDATWNITYQKGFHFYPHKTEGEGLYMTCLRKKTDEGVDEENSFDQRSHRKENRHRPIDQKSKKNELNASQLQELNHYLNSSESFTFIHHNDQLYAIDAPAAPLLPFILSKLRVHYPGLCVGKFMNNQLIPSHELALSCALKTGFKSIELSRDEAMIYLKKGDISALPQVQETENGWTIVTHETKPLGWIKKIGHRSNNYFPKELRVLKDF